MTTLLRPPAPVHSNPPEVGPYVRELGYRLGYNTTALLEAGRHFETAGTLADCPVVEPEDVELLDESFDLDGPREPLLSFPDWIETCASYYRSLGSDAADWLAAEIQELADLARALHAATPDQFDGRRAALSRSERNAEFDAFMRADADAEADDRLAGAQPW